jgi:hypothetical protein
MRRLLLVMSLMLTLVAFKEVAALPSFSNPLAQMNLAGRNFGDVGGTHIGTDLDGTAGDAIYAIADGRVCFYDGSAEAYGGGYGSCAVDGAVIFVRHRKANGDYFIAQYGHIQNVPLEFQQVVSYTTTGPEVKQVEKIAEIGVFSPLFDCSSGRGDHLHFGIWDSSNPIPMNHWGYTATPYSYCWTNPVGCWTDPMPFLTDENPYSFPYTSQFSDVYSRNGGSSTMGSAISGIYAYGPYLREDFDGGSYYDCCIMFDPNNGLGNPQATNEAYLLRTGFYSYYFSNGGYSAFGCPSRDEYHPETGASGDEIQFFVRRVGNETQQHYMYFEANLPTNQPPAEVLSWHSTYTTEWVTQDPNVQFNMTQGASRTLTVQFRNTGQFTWHNNSTSYAYDYIELKSCDAGGNVGDCFFNYPYSGSLGWIDAYSPCTMVESSVAPGQTATFTFTGKAASDASLGVHNVYLRPYHSTGGLLSDWGGMHFVVNVIAPVSGNDFIAFTGKFNNDNLSDVGLYDQVSGGWFVALNTGSAFVPSSYAWLGDWGASTTAFIPLIADFNRDGLTDIALYEKALGRWYVALNQGNSTFAQSGTYWLDNWGASADGFVPLVGDFNGDGYTDVCLYYKAGGAWYVALGNGSSFTPSAYAWLSNWGANATAFIPLASDYNGDGYTDVCLYYKAGGAWYVALGNGSSAFTPSAYVWLDNWGASSTAFTPLTSWFNGDGLADVMLYEKAMGRWYVGPNQGNSTFGAGGYWIDNWGASSSGFTPLIGDFNTDSRTDIGLYEKALGRWYVAMNQTNNTFSQSGTYWLDGWGVQSGSPKISPPGDQTSLPAFFILNQNYPNPFNAQTLISYSLPQSSHVRIDIYNVLGQNVTTLIDASQEAGEHQVVWNAGDQPTGSYFYRIATDNNSETKKMLLIK